uniref:RING-type domain-containing protein n=1 Tax=Heterorhabditis bacteriophora TaxID=37862 RepID=A0A1I7X526_HETBA
MILQMCSSQQGEDVIHRIEYDEISKLMQLWKYIRISYNNISLSFFSCKFFYLELVVASYHENMYNFQLILGADARLNYPRLRELLELVISSRSQSMTAVCYVCYIHADPEYCADHPQCLYKFRSSCCCVFDTCSICLGFLHSFELSICLSMLRKIDFEEEKRCG